MVEEVKDARTLQMAERCFLAALARSLAVSIKVSIDICRLVFIIKENFKEVEFVRAHDIAELSFLLLGSLATSQLIIRNQLNNPQVAQQAPKNITANRQPNTLKPFEKRRPANYPMSE